MIKEVAHLLAYLDNSATTKTLPQVNAAIETVLLEDYGNPSSLHRMGMAAEEKQEAARAVLAKTLGCKKNNLIFTSGGTESNNMAIIGSLLENKRRGNKVITSSVEHPSVRKPVDFLKTLGYEVTLLPVGKDGIPALEDLKNAVDENTALVSLMHVNNETGRITDIESYCRAVKEKNPLTLFHCDCVQSFLKVLFTVKELGVDFISISSHKINGPKGIGALYVKDGVRISPLLWGGDQERGLRSGTENTPGIVGFGEAVSYHAVQAKWEQEKINDLRMRLWNHLSPLDRIHLNTDLNQSAPHILNLSFLGIRSEILLHTLEEFQVYVSSGSACAGNSTKKKKVLEQMGYENAIYDSAIRFSLSSLTTKEEVDYAAEVVIREVMNIRKRLRL